MLEVTNQISRGGLANPKAFFLPFGGNFQVGSEEEAALRTLPIMDEERIDQEAVDSLLWFGFQLLQKVLGERRDLLRLPSLFASAGEKTGFPGLRPTPRGSGLARVL